MKAKEFFLAGVRLIGFWTIVEGVQELSYYVETHLGYLHSNATEYGYLVHATVAIVTGAGLIICSRELANMFSWFDPEQLARMPEMRLRSSRRPGNLPGVWNPGDGRIGEKIAARNKIVLRAFVIVNAGYDPGRAAVLDPRGNLFRGYTRCVSY